MKSHCFGSILNNPQYYLKEHSNHQIKQDANPNNYTHHQIPEITVPSQSRISEDVKNCKRLHKKY